MKLEKRALPTLLRRLEAAALAAGTLWTVHVTAGSENAAAAVNALRDAAYLSALRWELGKREEMLSTAAVMTLSQSPLLYSVRESVLELSDDPDDPDHLSDNQAADDPTVESTEENPDGAENTAPTENPPQDLPSETPPEPQKTVENGAIAKTLVPQDPSGYTVCGRVYISTSTDYTLSIPELQEPFDAELTGDAPQMLILHTHGSEAYTPAPGTDVVWSGEGRSTDSRWNVLRVGDEMASVFEEAGITVIHDRTLYDYPNYTGSYDRSLAAIRTYLAEYPSIRFVLDVHRDDIEDSSGRQYKVVSEIEGVGTAAQLTLVMGTDGSGLSHPNWKENLKLAVAVQEQILSKYPTLMRPLLLRKSRYNQHVTTGSMLVEVGATGNAPEEAILAARLFAQEMVEVLEARSK